MTWSADHVISITLRVYIMSALQLHSLLGIYVIIKTRLIRYWYTVEWRSIFGLIFIAINQLPIKYQWIQMINILQMN